MNTSISFEIVTMTCACLMVVVQIQMFYANLSCTCIWFKCYSNQLNVAPLLNHSIVFEQFLAFWNEIYMCKCQLF